MDKDKTYRRLVIDEGNTRTDRMYQYLRDWTPITNPCPILVQLLSTPPKTRATKLQDRQPNINPTAPTKQVGRMSRVSPQCKGCKALICTCNAKDQEEYQELENNNKPDHFRTSWFGKVFKQEIEDDANYRSWRTSSEKRWERRRGGKKDRPEDSIPYDDSEEECYKRWLEKLHRESPNRIKETRLFSILERIKEIRANKNKELRTIRIKEIRANRNPGGIGEHLSPPEPKSPAPSTSKEVILPNRVTSLTTHCCGKKMTVDLDKAMPLDDSKSNCKCETAPALRIITPYQINNKNRIKESKDALTSVTILEKYWPAETTQSQQHQKKSNPSTPTQVEIRLPSSVPLPGFETIRKPKPWRPFYSEDTGGVN